MGNPNLTILVLNLSPKVTVEDLTSFFSYCGHVEQIQLQAQDQGEFKDRCKQSALVTFRQPYAYQTALLLNDAVFVGQPIRILPKKNVANSQIANELPNVVENSRVQGNIPVVRVVEIMGSEGIERLSHRRDEVEEKYKLSEKSRMPVEKQDHQLISGAEQAARDVANSIMSTDYIGVGATWLSGVFDKTSKLVSEIGTRRSYNPNSRKYL